MSKRDTGIKALSLPLYLPASLSLYPQHPVSLLSVQQHRLTLHHLISVVDLHLQVLEEVFNPKGLSKILSSGIYETDTKCVTEESL